MKKTFNGYLSSKKLIRNATNTLNSVKQYVPNTIYGTMSYFHSEPLCLHGLQYY